MQREKSQEEKAKEREAYIRNILLGLFKKIPLLIRAKTIAEILGIPTSTIYEHIRRGKFFMSYRVINESPMVDTEEFIYWYAYLIKIPIPLPVEVFVEDIPEDLDERRVLLESRIDPVKKFFLKEAARLNDEDNHVSRKRMKMR